MGVTSIVCIYWLFAIVLTYIIRGISSKKKIKLPFEEEKKLVRIVLEHIAIWTIIPILFPFFAIPYAIGAVKKRLSPKKPRPVPKDKRKFLKKDTVFDENNNSISLAEYNYKHGTNFTLDQVYGKGYEASLNDDEKKELRSSSMYGYVKISDNLLDDVYTEYSKIFADALLSGDFTILEQHLDPKCELILHLSKSHTGVDDIVSYWNGWRERYVVSKQISKFEVLHSNYFAHACVQMETMLAIMHIDKNKIVKMILMRRHIAGGAYAHHDDLVNEYPFKYSYIKRFLKPLREANEFNGPVVKENRIPCFDCGIPSENLNWYSSYITVGIHGYPAVVSICPKCGKVIEYYTEGRFRLEKPVIDEIMMLEEYAHCWNNRTLGDLENYLSDDFHYTSHWVFEELDKNGYLEYFAGKLNKIEETNSDVKARLINDHLVVTQNGNNVVIDVKFKDNKIISACMSPASFFGIPDKEEVSKPVKFDLYGRRTFHNALPLKGTKYLNLIPENLEAQKLDYLNLSSSDPYVRMKLRTVAEECDWLFLGQLDKDNLEIVKRCYKGAMEDGIYEAANNLGVLAINYEDNAEEGNKLLNHAAFHGSQNAMINQFTCHWNNEEYLEGCAMLANMQNKANPSLKCLWNLAYLYFMGEDYPNNRFSKDVDKAKTILTSIINYDTKLICENEKGVPNRASLLLNHIDSFNIFSAKGIEFHDILLNSVIKTHSIKDKGEIFYRLTSISLEEGNQLGLRIANQRTSETGDVSNFFIYNNEEAEDKDIKKYLKVMPTAMGAWQVYLMMTAQTVMPVFWHGGYIVRKFIFQESDLEGIKPLKGLDLSIVKRQGILLPAVKIDYDHETNEYKATVHCCYWNDWKGLIRESISIRIKDGTITSYNTEKDFVLYQYDCGILF